ANANGPFIATKFDAVLEKRFGSGRPELAFLCPAERNAQKLADCMRDLVGYSTIRVKREVIDLFAAGKTLTEVESLFSHEASDQTSRTAFHQLETLSNVNEKLPRSERPSLVLLDEFTVSGRTFLGLIRIA